MDLALLAELVKNAKNSDRQIAKLLGISQPTVTRKRARLEKELSLVYTAVPDWAKLGYEIIAITFSKWKHEMYPDERVADALRFIEDHPNIIFISTGQGLESDRVCISLHKSYRSFHRLIQEFRQEWGKYMENLNSFIISIGADNILRPLTLRPLADYLTHGDD